MISVTGKGQSRLSHIIFIALGALLILQTGCSETQCTGCNFQASNLSLSTSGTFLFSPVTTESLKTNASVTFPLTINSDANYSGEILFSIMDPELRAIDSAGTVKITVAPTTLNITPGESAQVKVTVTSTSLTPMLSSQFYVTATDITVANKLDPYFVMVTVPLAITGP